MLAVVLSLTLMASLFVFTPSAVAASNLDTASAWAQEGITSAVEKGFVPWEIQYNYTEVITRSEFCRMAVQFVVYATGRTIDAILLENGLSRDSNAFTDTNDPDILAAYALGITSGTGDNQFTPNGQFSREQAATMIRNVCRVIGADVSNVPDAGYTDIDSVSSWAVDSVNFCYDKQIMTGTSVIPLLFSPKSTYTREQSIITFNNIDNSGITESAGIIDVHGVAGTQARSAANWASVSPVQQFAYMNEGLAYAYVLENDLIITTPTKTLNIEMRYPLLGDVLSDDDGNFYVVWGRANETNNTSIETVFITKYTPDGQHIKTTGFVGASSPWGNSDDGKTKIPFHAGNSVSVIANGVLVNYHGKQRYDGHQSDGVVAVNISDMSVHHWPNNTYAGHSFNQSIIFSDKASDFRFASHGDAYARGFRVNGSNGRYNAANEILFHFYLEANANYDMRIVNRTFAQLGGLAETSAGVALVGASAKSISEAAKTEKQNLFVQIFNPRATTVSSAMFVGGTTRSGATSFDINDNSNTPLTPVTDYGVRWLTDYTDTDVIAPQVVTANDRLVILFSTQDDTFYMVLSASGDVLIPVTSLGGIPLNSFEQPIYHNGAVYWAAVENGRLKVSVLEI